MLLGAPHHLQVISNSSDTEMAKFLTENSKKIDGKNLNLEVTLRLAVCFKKETVLEFLAKKMKFILETQCYILDTQCFMLLL